MALSILIPTCNDSCIGLVQALQAQAETLGNSYEIVVADDGSTDEAVLAENAPIASLPHCRYIRREQNAGRAAIRNFLAREAQYDLLLFIDSDMTVCRQDFLKKYMSTIRENSMSPSPGEELGIGILDGGVAILLPHQGKTWGRSNLRYAYERAAEQEHTVEKRRANPYRDFHTANFMIRRDLMLTHPFDERYRHYGYEDVAFGITLKEHNISILHIDNPMGFETFESNEAFVSKTEEGLRTLHAFRDELHDYSRLLQKVEALPRPALSAIRCLHRLMGGCIRRNLTGSHPWLPLFNIYKLGYYLTNH